MSHVSRGSSALSDKVRILDPDVRSDTPSSVTQCHGVIRDFFFQTFSNLSEKYYIRREMGGVEG